MHIDDYRFGHITIGDRYYDAELIVFPELALAPKPRRPVGSCHAHDAAPRSGDWERRHPAGHWDRRLPAGTPTRE
jgi:hypothetical protein